MPKPHKGESQQDFVDRCVPVVLDDGSASSPEQAVAMCHSIWEEAHKSGVMSTETAAPLVPAQKFTRGYSVLQIKAIQEDKRFIAGIATTPEPDRVGDIVEPLGISFKNPAPLLWQHHSDEPVGLVKFGKPTKDGMTFEAQLAKVDEPGALKDRLDEAWQSVKLGLVRAVSIGFRALEMSFLKDGGVHFIQTEVLELSLVTIPANMEATITTIKAIDGRQLRENAQRPVLLPPPAAPGQPAIQPPGVTGPVKLIKPKEAIVTLQEQLAAYQSTRASKNARMVEIMTKSADAGETLDQTTSEEYDTLEQEVAQLDTHIGRFTKLVEANKGTLVPVNGSGTTAAGNSRAGTSMTLETRRHNPLVTVKANVPPGTAFTRYCMAVAAAKGSRYEAIQRAARDWHDQTPEVELVLSHDIEQLMKAAQGAGTTLDATFASPLVAYQIMVDEFIALLRPATIIGRIPGLRLVPFNIQMPRATTGSSVGWVGEGAPKPLTSMAFDTVQLRWAKAAGIIVLTAELVRFSSPSSEAVVRSDLVGAMAQFLDKQFVDPSVAAVTNVSPASITNGVTPVTASGVTAAAFFTDVRALFAGFFAANLSTAGGVWIMTQTQALALSLIQNTLGQNVFPTITATGGTLLGYPVIASENIPATGNSPVDGYPIIFAVPQEILLADDGQTVIDASNQASVNMDTAPDSPPSASTILVSLWQMNMVGLRAERWINWLKRRTAAVQFIQNAKYTG